MPDDSRAALRAAMKKYKEAAPETKSAEIKKQEPINNAENKPVANIENIKRSIFAPAAGHKSIYDFDPAAPHKSIYAKTYKEDLAKEAELKKAFKTKVNAAPGKEAEAFENNLHVQNTYNKPINTNIQTLQNLVNEAEALKKEIDKTKEEGKINRFNSLVEQIKTLEKQTDELSDQKYRLYQQFETKNNVDYTDYFTKKKAEIQKLRKESGLSSTLAYYLTPYSPSKTLKRITNGGLELKAAESILKDTERLYKAPTKQEGTGVGNFAKNVKDIASENEFWENIITLGISDLEDKAVILRTVKKAESGQSLNKNEEILMDALLSKTLISAQREGNLSIGYQGGQMLTESIPFMLSFLATSGVAGGITKGTAKATQKAIYNYTKRKLEKKLGKEATEAAMKEAEAQALLKLSTNRLAKITPKITAGAADITVGSAVRAPLMPTSYSQFTEDITPTVTGKTEKGGYLTQKGMTPIQAIKDVYIEVASEATGGAFNLGIVGKLLNKAHIDKLLNNPVGNRLNQVLFKSNGILDRAGFNGLIKEIGVEENIGNAARYITDVIDKEEFKDFYSWENQAAMISSFSVMGLLGIVPNEINRKKIYTNYKNQINNLNLNLNLKPNQINELNSVIDNANYKEIPLALADYALKNNLIQASDIERGTFSQNAKEKLNELLAYSIAYTEKKAINNSIQAENPQIPFGAEVIENEVHVLNGKGETLYSNSYSTSEEAKEVATKLNEQIELIHKEQEAKQDISDSIIYDNDEIRNDNGAIYEFNVTETNELPKSYIPKMLNEKPTSIHLRTSIEELNDPDLKVVVVKEKYVKQDEHGNPVITNVDNVISVDLAKKLLEKSQLYTPEAEKEIANDIAEKTISNTKIQELEAKNGGIYVNTDAGRMLIPEGSYQILNIEGDEIELIIQDEIEGERPTTFITTLQEQGYVQNEEFNENAGQEVEKIGSDGGELVQTESQVPETQDGKMGFVGSDGGTTEKTAQARELDLNNPEDELIYTEQKIGKEKTAKHAKKIIKNLNKQIESINKQIDKETKLSKIADLEGQIQEIEGQIQLYNDYISSAEQISEPDQKTQPAGQETTEQQEEQEVGEIKPTQEFENETPTVSETVEEKQDTSDQTIDFEGTNVTETQPKKAKKQLTETSSSEKPNNSKSKQKEYATIKFYDGDTRTGEVIRENEKEISIKEAIEKINDGKRVVVVNDINAFLKKMYNGVQNVIDKIKDIERDNLKIRGIYANGKIIISSNQTVAEAISAFIHERQHVENKTDKDFIKIQQDIINDVNYNELEEEVRMLSEGTGYNGLSKSTLADEYVAFIVQHFHDKTGIKSNLKYQKIIEDEYERKNKNRSHGNRGNLHDNRNAGELYEENNKESREGRYLLSGSVRQESGRWKEKINLFENRYEREILLPLHNIIKEGKIDYEQLKEITGRIESGNATIKRLDKEEEQGRSQGGKRAIEATIIAGGIRSSNRENKEKLTAEQELLEEENILREYAKHENILLTKEYFDQFENSTSGAENIVYFSPETGKVTKIANYKLYSESPLEFIDNRIALHNFLFEETKYELIGFTDTEDGLCFVLTQPYIIGDNLQEFSNSPKSLMDIKNKLADYMKANFDMNPVGDSKTMYFNSNYIIEDLHLNNVRLGEDGNFYFIDTVISLNEKSDDLGGIREYEDFAIVDNLRFNLAPTSDIGFYSTVENALLNIKQEKGTPEQFKAMLLKNGAKQAELDWMDYDGTFTGKSVTKADIQQWIDENRIEVEEVQKGAYSNRDLELVKVEPFVYNVVDTKTGKVVLSNVSQSRADDFIDNAHDGTDTKFAQYTLPGGENYKEVLLTMPKDKGLLWKQNKAGLWAYFVGDKQVSDGVPDDTYKEIARNTINSRDVRESQNADFKSGHFDEPNILAHIRFNERTDSEGNKVLFIEEIQSDWAQEGKKEGFKDNNAESKINDLQKQLKSKYPDERMSDILSMTEDPLVNELTKLYDEKSYKKVPNMPFKKTDQWVNLALRRMMRYAAENGFDRIAWTNGEQQADRYDLSKQVDDIWTSEFSNSWNGKQYEKLKDVEITLKGGEVKKLIINESGKVVRGDFEGESLDNVVGKEMAEKIIGAQEDTNFGEQDLKVGGEGMKAFYDGIVPSAMSKLGKPFNAKVETIEIEGIGQQQSIPITEKMKESVMEGMPLFNISPEMSNIISEAKANGTYLKAPNGKSTNLNEKQWVQVRTKAFKDWFGDWENAVKPYREVFQERHIAFQDLKDNGLRSAKFNSSDGSITVYHGTSKDIEGKIFDNGFNDSTYFSINKNGTTNGDSPLDVAKRKFGKDATVMEIKIDPRYIELAAGGSELYSPYRLVKGEDGVYSKEVNASKVVDENGEPLVVYHGGGKNIIAFDYNRIGQQGRSEGAGFEFTENKLLAEEYADRHGDLYSVFLNIRNSINNIEQKTLTKKQKIKILTLFNDKVNNNKEYDLGANTIFSDYSDSKNINIAINKVIEMLSDDTDLDFINEFINTTHMNKEILEAFKEVTGYDGVILDKTDEWTKNGLYVVFTNTQIKSAIDNVGTFDSENEDIRFNLAPTSDIGFYSTVENALLNIKQDKGTREQFKGMLLNNGAKQAEMDWMGFDELPEKLTKSDIQNWIDENRIEVQEVEKESGDMINPNTPYYEAAQEYAERNGYYFDDRGVDGYSYIFDEESNETVAEGFATDIARSLNLDVNEIEEEGDTKYFEYQLPNGKNYKELLLTMPAISKYDESKLPDDYRLEKTSNGNYVITKDGVKLQGTVISYNKDEVLASYFGGKSEQFKSYHFTEPNILAHIRFNEREVNGERVLFIEEFQSDWAQTGKKEGFKGDATYEPILEKKNVWDVGGVKVLYFERGIDGKNYRTINKKREQVWFNNFSDAVKEANNTVKNISEKEIFKVPNMPFKKTDQWLKLAARRMMRYAAENGFDRIAWTNGEQQADRYDLSKQVDDIWTSEFSNSWNGKQYEKLKDVEITLKGGEVKKLIINESGKVVRGDFEGESLDNVVGKEMAEKIIGAQEDTNFGEQDLKVGGEGMKAFYDGIVPSAMSKLGKPFNAKVETIEIEGIGQQQSIPITEKMKESVMEGMPLFNISPEMSNIISEAKANGTYLKAPNGKSTNLNEIQWVQVRTKAFKDWFGDWENDPQNASKIVDENGEPMVVFHGTPKGGFNTFREESYFTKNKEYAERYKNPNASSMSYKAGQLTPELYEVYLSIKKPFDTRNVKEKNIFFKEFFGKYGNGAPLSERGLPDWTDATDLLEFLQEKDYNYDGLIIDEGGDGGYGLDVNFRGESYVPFSPTQIKSATANIGTFDVENEDIRFNISPIPENRLVEAYIDAYNSKDYPTFKAKLQDVQKIKEKMRESGMKPFTNKDLDVLRKLIKDNGYTIEDAINYIASSTDINAFLVGSKQRQNIIEKYKNLKETAKHKDIKQAIKDATEFAKAISEDKTWGEWKLMDENKRIAIKQILTQLENASSKKDINRELDRLFDIIIERQNSVAKDVLNKALNLKISDTSWKGIRVGKNVDDNTRVAIETLKENLNKGVSEIASKIEGLSEKLETEQDELVKADLSSEILGLRYALLYAERINGIIEEISKSKEELNAINKENKKELETYIRENMISLQNNLEFFINEVTGLIQEGIAARNTFLAKEELHNSEILHNAFSDLKHVKEKVFTSRDKKFVRTALLAITSPLRTFSTMLKEMGKYFPEGKGYLYKRFVEEGIIKAAQNEYLGIKEVEDTLAENIKRIFGEKYSLAKLGDYANKSKGVSVEIKRGKISEVKELNNGHVMYIYMVNKMSDGKMKLREMGITEADVEKMKNTLSDKAIEFCDYVQDELLPDLRKKYNKTHVKLFGIQMDEIENYFPLKIAQEAIKKEKDLDDQTNYLVPSMVTGAIIRRKKNKKTLNIMEANAIDVLQAYIKEMEYWNAYAFMIKDLNTLNSNLLFKNKLNSLSDGMANRFFELSQIAVKKYDGKRSEIDEFITKASKFIAVSKISFRLNTAIKQILGLTAYLHEISDPNFLKYGLKNMIDIKNNIKWCKKNLPLFEKRWTERTGGDDKLSLSDENLNKLGNTFNKISSKGLIPNAFIDLIASSCGAKTMYETKFDYYKKRYPEDIAREKALVAAENIYNETQQSGESLYMSKVQSDRTFMSASFSLFNNASFSYGRQLLESLRGIQAYAKDGRVIIDNKKKMYIREGLTEENAEKFAKEDTRRSLARDVLRVGVFGYIVQAAWNIASDNSIAENISNIYTMLFGDDDDKEKLKEEKSLELKKGLLLGLIQPVRGLIGGKELESLLSLTIEGYDPNFVASSMRANPLGGDIMQFYKDIIDSANKGDWMLIANALLTLSTSFTGSNINSIYNSIYAIYDFIATSDVTIHDVAYDLGLLANIPKSKQKSLALTPREGEKLEDYIERYVKLKRMHKYGVFSIIANKKPTKYEETAVAKEINYQYDNLNITVREIKKVIEEKKENDILFEFRPKTYQHALKVLGIYSKEYKKRLLTSRERSILQKAYEDLINDPEYKEKID